jgi:hypothetical protein
MFRKSKVALATAALLLAASLQPVLAAGAFAPSLGAVAASPVQNVQRGDWDDGRRGDRDRRDWDRRDRDDWRWRRDRWDDDDWRWRARPVLRYRYFDYGPRYLRAPFPGCYLTWSGRRQVWVCPIYPPHPY